MIKKIINITELQDKMLKDTAKELGITSSEVVRRSIYNFCVNDIEYPDFLFSDISYEDFVQSLVKVKSLDDKIFYPIMPTNLTDVFTVIESLDLRVAEIYMNSFDFRDVRKWGKDILDIETRASEIRKGKMAKIWGASVIVCNRTPVSKILVLSESKHRVGCIASVSKQPISEKVKEVTLDQLDKKIDSHYESLMKELSNNLLISSRK